MLESILNAISLLPLQILEGDGDLCTDCQFNRRGSLLLGKYLLARDFFRYWGILTVIWRAESSSWPLEPLAGPCPAEVGLVAGIDGTRGISCDRCLLTEFEDALLTDKAGMMLVISAIVAASEWDEPARLAAVVRGGREDEVVGRMVRFGVVLNLLPEVWIWSLCRIEGRFGAVEVEDSPEAEEGS